VHLLSRVHGWQDVGTIWINQGNKVGNDAN
jgi:hypothetical protein